MSFDKTTLKLLRDQLNQHLAAFDTMDGLTLRIGNCRFDGAHATFKLEVSLEGAESQEMQDLRRYASFYGIDPDKTHPVYTLVGYSSKAKKYPFLVTKRGATGTYKITESQALGMFKKDSEEVA